MTYEADENLTPDKVFILKSEEISDYGVAKQEQLLDLMGEAVELYPDASAQQVIEFAKQRLLTRNVLSSYQEITAPPLPSLLELTAGPASEEPEDETVEEELETEVPGEESEVWYAPEDGEELSSDEDVPVDDSELDAPEEHPQDEAESSPEELNAGDDLPVQEEEVISSEEPAEEAEYTLEEEVEDHFGEEQLRATGGNDSSREESPAAYSSEEESTPQEVPAVEQPQEALVTSYDQSAPTVLKKDRRWVGLLEAASRLDAKGD